MYGATIKNLKKIEKYICCKFFYKSKINRMISTIIIHGSLNHYKDLFCSKLLTLSWCLKTLIYFCSSVPAIEIKFDLLCVNTGELQKHYCNLASLLLSASSNSKYHQRFPPKNSKSIEMSFIKYLIIGLYASTSTYLIFA